MNAIPCCTIPGCTNPHKAKGWCRRHYELARNHGGDPLSGGLANGAAPVYFRAHVDDVTDHCILWPYSTAGRGYGQLWLDGRLCNVHVLACIHHHGPRPPGMHALHVPVICHNQLCFNGRHLFWGTQKENMAHKALDGTALIGERHGMAKLTWQAVTEIRVRYAAGGISQGILATEYGVSRATISLMVTGRIWKVS